MQNFVRAERSEARTQTIATVALLVSGLLLGARVASAWTQSQFVIGTFLDPFHVSDPLTSAQLYKQAVDANFNLITGTPSDFHTENFRPPDLNFDANLLTASGVGLVSMVADPYFYLRAMRQWEEGDAVFDPVIAQQVTQHYAGLSAFQRQALFGYNLGDEPLYGCNPCGTISGQSYQACNPPGSCPGPLPFLRQWAAALHTADPDKPVYINLIGMGGHSPRRRCTGSTFAST